MKNPIAGIVVAAVVAIAGITGLVLWRGTGSEVALADVLARLRQVSVCMYQMTLDTTGPTLGDNALEQTIQATVLMSDDLGMKVTMEMDIRIPGSDDSEAMTQEVYVLPERKKMLTVMHALKKYLEVDMDNVEFEKQQKQNNAPDAMVERILACNYESLGKSTIDGVAVEGFGTTDPNYMSGMMSGIDVKIWVDINTHLPIRSEMDMEMAGGIRAHVIIHDFQWDITVEASEFDPLIPDDYATMTGAPIELPDINEDTAVEGLKLAVRLSGRYPEKLDLATLMSDIMDFSESDNAAFAEQLGTDEDLTEQQRLKKRIDLLMPLQAASMFYTTLVGEGKDPGYYGDTVTPEDKDQVLMRWRTSDSEYRVIFGDLRVETVTADVLAEIEKALPQ